MLETRIRQLNLEIASQPEAGVEVHQVDVASTAATAFEPAELRPLLSTAENERAERFLRPGLRSRYIYTRAALRLLLAKRVGLAPEQLRFGATAEGRPFLCAASSDSPRPELDFNLSHSGDLALIAIGNGKQRLGIDIERIKPMRDIDQMAKRVLTPVELDHLASAPNEVQKLSTFFRYWTLKEAYLKALGTGLQVDMKRVEIELLNTEPSQPHRHQFRRLPQQRPQQRPDDRPNALFGRPPSLSLEFIPAEHYRAVLLLLAAGPTPL